MMIDLGFYFAPVALIAALVMLMASIRIMREYERAEVFTLGRFEKVM